MVVSMSQNRLSGKMSKSFPWSRVFIASKRHHTRETVTGVSQGAIVNTVPLAADMTPGKSLSAKQKGKSKSLT